MGTVVGKPPTPFRIRGEQPDPVYAILKPTIRQPLVPLGDLTERQIATGVGGRNISEFQQLVSQHARML